MQHIYTLINTMKRGEIMKSIVLCGGGTAGHIMPNIALLPELMKNFDQIYYIGGANSLEQKIVAKHNIKFYTTDVVKFERHKLFANLKIPFKLLKGINSAKKILRMLNPSIIFCKGGYASLPTAYAARFMKIPVICHESDMTLGLANKLISPFAAATFTTFKATNGRGNLIYTGLPIRENIGVGNKEKLLKELNLPDRPNILVIGGSLGSQAINNTVFDSASELLKTYNIIHITGKKESNYKSNNYRSVAFADNIADYFALADVVVSRAGATACAELSYLKKKMLLIPLPKGTSRGDQVLNAKAYEAAGAAKVLLQKDLSKDSLIMSIKALMTSPSPHSEIKTASNVEIVNLIAKYSRK